MREWPEKKIEKGKGKSQPLGGYRALSPKNGNAPNKTVGRRNNKRARGVFVTGS